MFLVELKDAVFMSGSIELPVQFFLSDMDVCSCSAVG